MAKAQRALRHTELMVFAGHKIRLSDVDPGYTDNLKSKQDARKKLTDDLRRLTELQDVFYAARKYALLIIFQGIDSAGKDGAVKHVMAGVNPAGVEVHQFKEPTQEELAHDFLWRCAKVLPPRGCMGIFNRSYYEEVLVVRVHPDLLRAEAVSRSEGGDIWAERYEDINAFEHHLVRNGTHILKFFLHISKEEQRRRFLERIEEPHKNWKVSAADLTERKYWDDYMRAYEAAINHTSTAWAPWYVIPSDHKWFARTAIGDAIVGRLEELRLTYPKPSKAEREALNKAKKILEHEG